MDGLPEEIILHIFSYLPVTFVFRTVSLVSKDFRRLAYDRHIVVLALDVLAEIDIGRKGCLNREAFHRLLHVINLAPTNVVKSLTLRNSSETLEVLFHSRKKLSNLLILNLSGTRCQLPKNMIPFGQLRELNVSGTSIDDQFLIQVSRMCKHLYCLNISKCFNVTQDGILQASFNLTVINMAFCWLSGEAIIHAIREYGCTLVCTRGIHLTNDALEAISTLFPDVFEVGIPVICGFSFGEFSCPNVCCWCSESDYTRNFLSLDSSLNPYEF